MTDGRFPVEMKIVSDGDAGSVLEEWWRYRGGGGGV